MDSYFAIIILLLLAVGLSPVASKMKIPYPVMLLLGGIAMGFIPGYEPVAINPEIVFFIFLPPMLFDAAIHTAVSDFKTNIRTISFMAVALVFLTTAAIAAVAHFCIDGMSWGLAFVLGAILSPPDAIAAMGVTKGLGLSRRANTILEGESLINDASALVALRFAIAVVAGGVFVPWKAGIMFVFVMFGGIVVGFVIWHLFAFVIRRKWLTNEVISVLSMMLPFIAYIIAEQVNVSGVIAVVTTGLILAICRDRMPKDVLVQTRASLDTLMFVLSAIVFILIGLAFPSIVRKIGWQGILPLFGWSLLIFAIALVVRMGLVFVHNMNIENKKRRIVNITFGKPYRRLFFRHNNRRLRLNARRRSRLRIMNTVLTPITLHDRIIIGWSGMRGIVSLAAAMSIPLVLDSGAAFPMREEIIFLTTCVVISMLTVQGLGLPLLLKWLSRRENKQKPSHNQHQPH